MTLCLQQADDEMSKGKLFPWLVYARKKSLQATPNLPTLQCSISCSLVPACCYQQSPLITLPSDSLASRLKMQLFPKNSKAFPQLLRSQLGGKPQGCFCEDRTPTVSQSIIRHLSKLQRIRSRKKRVREFYMHYFVQKKIMKGKAKTIYQS